MSLTDALSRISELQRLVQPQAPAASPSAPSALFAAALENATGPAATAAGPTAAARDTVPAEMLPVIQRAAHESGVDPALVAAVARAESGFNPAAVSPAGAQGLMQLMPGTARGLGVTDPFDAAQSASGGAKYLRAQLDRFRDPELALAAYNAGPNAVTRAGGIPPYAATQAYVHKVMGYYRAYRAEGMS
jgi:soluble lytic murein transglycosylase-like protein